MISIKSKHQHPPICPKTPKTLKNPRGFEISIKISDLRLPSPLSLQKDIWLRTRILPSHKLNNNFLEEIFRSEYQQYSRRNYLRRAKGEGRQGKVGSDLTDQLRIKRNLSAEQDRRCKSKSALDYAKYYIRQASNVPTQPSSKEPQRATTEQTVLGPEKETIENAQQSSREVVAREESKSKNRTNIMQKLKSLKNIRSKSRASVSRDLVPSLEKRSISKPKKLTANLTNPANESLMARMKARSRNRRIVLKVRQLNQSSPLEESMNLMLSSLIDRSHSDRAEVAEKLQLHLELLNLLPSYVKQFKQIYEDVECWDELLFLTYKKFYLERRKIEQSLTLIDCHSPFRLPFASVSSAQLKDFTHSVQGIQLQQKVRAQNHKIQGALRELYNHIIEKSGRYINLLELDNFSFEVYWLMSEEVRLLLADEEGSDLQSTRWRRVALTIKCFYLLTYLNGEEVDIESVLMGSQIGQEQVDSFWIFLQKLGQ